MNCKIGAKDFQNGRGLRRQKKTASLKFKLMLLILCFLRSGRPLIRPPVRYNSKLIEHRTLLLSLDFFMISTSKMRIFKEPKIRLNCFQNFFINQGTTGGKEKRAREVASHLKTDRQNSRQLTLDICMYHLPRDIFKLD